MKRLRVGLLGPVAVWCGDQRLDITAGKIRALVTLLALQGGRDVSRSVIVDGLWGEDPPSSATNAVQVYVSTLRRALGLAGVDEPRDLVKSNTIGYSMSVEPADVDASRFERLVRDGTAALERGEPEAAATILTEGLACWFADRALADVDNDFADPIRTRLDELRMVAVEHHIDARMALGASSDLVPELEALVGSHPYRESLWQRLAVALYRAGRQADALACIARARTVLLEEFGIDPGPALAACEVSILRQDEDLLLSVPHEPGTSVSPATVPRVDTQPSFTVVRDRVLGLSAPPGRFLGREHDLATLQSELTDGSTRLLTLTGPGGVGKTRLALALSERALADFDTVAFVDLAAVDRGEAIVPALASVLGIDSESGAAGIAEHLADRKALAVLDNLEQVRSAAAPVGALLSEVPALTVIVTSRSPLHLVVENEHRVAPLPIDDARALFVERARVTGVVVDADVEDAALSRICGRLDCLPLALELAAARVRLLGLGALEERLDDHGLAALGRGRADAPERHRTLESTVRWSLDLMDPTSCDVYEVLGCFVGGATLDAVESVANLSDGTELLSALDTLVDASLVPPPELDGPTPRFRLLETVRQDAADRLAERADADVLYRRHAAHYASKLDSDHPPTSDDLPNVRLAVDRLVTVGDLQGAAALTIEGRHLWFESGALDELRERYASMLECDLDPVEYARVEILHECLAYVTDGSSDQQRLANAIETLRSHGSRDPVAINAFCYLGMMALDEEDGAAAQEHGEQAVAWASGPDPAGESMALDFLAHTALQRDDPAQAATYVSRAVELAREHESAAHLAQRLASLAKAQLAAADVDAAQATATEALELARSSSSRPAERDALVALAEATRSANPAAASVRLAEASTAALEMGQPGIDELTRLARALADAGEAHHAATVTGVAARRRQTTDASDPEIDETLQDLQATLDADEIANGAELGSAEVTLLLSKFATGGLSGRSHAAKD